VHPRLSVSAVSSWQQSFDDDLAMWERLGVDHVGLSLRKCETVGWSVAARGVQSAGLRVSNVVECGWPVLDARDGWDAQRGRLLDAVAQFHVPIVVTTGPAGSLGWHASADAFAAFIRPVMAEGAHVAIENTSPMRVDLSFVTTLRDTVDLAGVVGTDVCVEVNSCWMERDLDATLRGAATHLAHVQVSDWRVGSLSTPDRCVPGDGDIPLARILRTLDGAGYTGAFELEMVGPQIESEGYEPAIRRAITAMDALLRG
jgi:sugar phosphate isomerase/epimerase